MRREVRPLAVRFRLPVLLFLIAALLAACAAPAAPAKTGAPPGGLPSASAAPATTAPPGARPAGSAMASASPPVAASGSPTATVSGSPTAAALGQQAQPLPQVRPGSGAQPSPTAQPLPTRASSVTPTASPFPTGQPTLTPSLTPTPAPGLLDQYLPRRKQVAETEHFIFYAQDGYFPVDQAWWTQEAETLYAYVSQRLRAQAPNKIALAFLPPETRACPVRGLAVASSHPVVLIYADAQSQRPYLQAVLAHELGHAIPAESFTGGLPDDLALTEGLATWAAGSYWAAWKGVPSLDDLIRQYLATGQYEPIHQNYDLHGIYPWQKDIGASQACLARRDKVYTEWADFLGYLIDTYGWPDALRLFQNPPPIHESGRVITRPPDYEGIYGKSLNQLEWEWLTTLENSKPGVHP